MSSPLSTEPRQKYPTERVMNWGLCEDTGKVSKLAKWSRFTGRNVSSILNRCREKRPVAQLSLRAFTQQGGDPGLKPDKGYRKILKQKVKVCQVGKGQIDEEQNDLIYNFHFKLVNCKGKTISRRVRKNSGN